MQLDRFTERAQATVLRAQETAQHLESPVLDAEHLLAALVEEDDGVPAETLRRLGDEYVSTEHLLLGVAEVGGEGQRLLESQGANREAILQALQSVRGGQRVTSPNPEGTYAALEKYGRDLTAEARAGKVDPVIGRDEEIRRVIQVLSRRTKNNPVLIGEPGV